MPLTRQTLLALLPLAFACTDSTSPTEDSDPTGTSGTWPSHGAWTESCPVDAAEERRIALPSLSLNVACRGAGPTVLFLHGFPEWWYSWNGVMDELADSYRLVAPDQRGYNTSDKPEKLEEYQYAALIDDIAALVPEISPGPVLLVAHDWGGPVAWGVAHTHPDLFRGLVAANAPHPNVWADLVLNDPEQTAASAYMAFFRSEFAESWLTDNDFRNLEGLFDGALSEEDLPLFKEAWGQTGAITGGLNWYRANNIEDPESAERFGQVVATIDIPTRVLWGLDDSALLPQNLDGLPEYVSDLEILSYEGVDHWIEHRMAPELAAQIRDFEQGLP